MAGKQAGEPPIDRDTDPTLLIADVAALTGVAAPQLRSWEGAGLLQPRRLPNGTRLYGTEDVALVRLIVRSLVNPGRRGSLRRLAADLARGDLRPERADYAGLAPSPSALVGTRYWRSVVESMPDLVLVSDMDGRVTAMNPALRALLGTPGSGTETLPTELRELPLRWAALTGTQHRDLALTVSGSDGARRSTLWSVAPLRAEEGAIYGAIATGRTAAADPAGQAEWVAMAAHDLRSPVAVIMGRLELARHTAGRVAAAPAAARGASEALLDRHLAAAERATTDLIRILDTLVDASAAAAGALISQLEPSGVDLGQVSLEAVEHAQERTSRHAIGLQTPAEALLVAGDRVRLRQVLDNLLTNAIKFAPEGGPIDVRLEAVPSPPAAIATRIMGDSPLGAGTRGTGWRLRGTTAAGGVPAPLGEVPRWALVRVRDTGLGIPAEGVPQAFDRFWRAAGPARRVPGTGLGLYTCRAIAAAHGGHIWVEESIQYDENREQEWHGTVIALLLPLAETIPATGPVADGEQRG